MKQEVEIDFNGGGIYHLYEKKYFIPLRTFELKENCKSTFLSLTSRE